MKQAYWEAGIQEYWIVDARDDEASFDVLYYTSHGYAIRRKKGGWVKSEVFGKSFRLVRTMNALKHPEFSLQVK